MLPLSGCAGGGRPADQAGIGERFFFCFAGRILVDREKARHAAAALIFGAHETARTFRRNQPVFLDQLVYRLVAIGFADCVFGETPVFRNAIKAFVGRDHAEFVGPGNKHGRSVEFCHVV